MKLQEFIRDFRMLVIDFDFPLVKVFFNSILRLGLRGSSKLDQWLLELRNPNLNTEIKKTFISGKSKSVIAQVNHGKLFHGKVETDDRASQSGNVMFFVRLCTSET